MYATPPRLNTIPTRLWYLGIVVAVLLFVGACSPTPPVNPAGLQAVTAVPTLDTDNPDALCKAAGDQWGKDWPTTIRALELLKPLDVTCSDGMAIPNRLYIAYMAYGALLEQRGHREDAIVAYQSALENNKLSVEAAERLRILGVLTPEPPERCEPAVVMEALSAVTEYTPTVGRYVQIADGHFTLGGEPYPVYGVDYYPRDTPGKRFLTETDVESIDFELDLLQAAGLNTLRIFIRHDVLFQCPGNGAVPIADNFVRLDAFIRLTAARDFKLILTLNDAPDLIQHPLYENPSYVTEQLIYLVTRYRNEPTIMAWDVRDAGDLDYAISSEQPIERDSVLAWLTQTALTVRETDSNHLITAGWRNDAEATIPAVDFVSFQHYGDFDRLRQTIANLKSQTDKPILLTAVGYSTYEGVDEVTQRNLLYQAFDAVQRNELAGWVIWTAFDYPLSVTCSEPDCVDQESALHHFGMWNTSYFPKLAVEAIKKVTGVEESP